MPRISKLSIARKIHNELCMEDHGAMYCVFGGKTVGGVKDTKKWTEKAQKIIDFSRKHKISANKLAQLIIEVVKRF